ncbi:hypothetical protein [Erwinia persicina]|uniref:Uncharacterized protein n=1 Tax=Erwinia persicina TaxID=55211 RepID=A0A4U3EST0_9GAMM|nr:hypothetical protein [Erwinia persicina]TKJ82862.1 hypothetical protein EpCFBP13511_23615 [Erwinia persicina]
MLERLLKREGLAIAAGTMLLYTSVYFFERGYCTHLNIPLDYIEISIPTIANDVMYSLFLIFPIAVISMVIMIAGERNEYKGRYAFSPFYCWLVYTVVFFYFMEHTWGNAFTSFFLGGLFFMQITPTEKKEDKPSLIKIYHSSFVRVIMGMFLLSTTFVIYGNSFAAKTSFDTYTQNGKKFALLKVYGENVFMQEIVDGKRVSEITYFNSKNMSGMALNSN